MSWCFLYFGLHNQCLFPVIPALGWLWTYCEGKSRFECFSEEQSAGVSCSNKGLNIKTTLPQVHLLTAENTCWPCDYSCIACYFPSFPLFDDPLTCCSDHCMNCFLFFLPFFPPSQPLYLSVCSISLAVRPWLEAGLGKFDKIMNCHACCSFSHFTAQ